jgi:hemerythrin-like domain-containing protein
MNAFFEELVKDHEEVKGLLHKMIDSSEGAVKTRQTLFAQLKGELIPHMKGEEKAFYPRLMGDKEAKKHTLEAVEEHSLAETVFHQLEKMPVDDETWGAKLKVLKDLIEHHIEEEEEELFETSEQAIGQDEFKTIMQDFQKEKGNIKKGIA